jgi:predicted metal-binding protein
MSEAPRKAIVTVCTNCRPEGARREEAPGAVLHEALTKAAVGRPEIVVRPTQCLSVCRRVCTISLSGEGAYTFLFGDLDAARDAGAVIDMAIACAAAPHGFVPWKARPEVLRKGLIARVPPPGWSPADGSAPA